MFLSKNINCFILLNRRKAYKRFENQIRMFDMDKVLIRIKLNYNYKLIRYVFTTLNNSAINYYSE